MEQFELSTDEIDYYVFHQGQKLILKGLMDICDIEYEIKNIMPAECVTGR